MRAGRPVAQTTAVGRSAISAAPTASRNDRVSLAVLAVLATIAIFMTRLLPTTPAGRRDHDPATDSLELYRHLTGTAVESQLIKKRRGTHASRAGRFDALS
jgi:hypothetical protein